MAALAGVIGLDIFVLYVEPGKGLAKYRLMLAVYYADANVQPQDAWAICAQGKGLILASIPEATAHSTLFLVWNVVGGALVLQQPTPSK